MTTKIIYECALEAVKQAGREMEAQQEKERTEEEQAYLKEVAFPTSKFLSLVNEFPLCYHTCSTFWRHARKIDNPEETTFQMRLAEYTKAYQYSERGRLLARRFLENIVFFTNEDVQIYYKLMEAEHKVLHWQSQDDDHDMILVSEGTPNIPAGTCVCSDALTYAPALKDYITQKATKEKKGKITLPGSFSLAETLTYRILGKDMHTTAVTLEHGKTVPLVTFNAALELLQFSHCIGSKYLDQDLEDYLTRFFLKPECVGKIMSEIKDHARFDSFMVTLQLYAETLTVQDIPKLVPRGPVSELCREIIKRTCGEEEKELSEDD